MERFSLSSQSGKVLTQLSEWKGSRSSFSAACLAFSVKRLLLNFQCGKILAHLSVRLTQLSVQKGYRSTFSVESNKKLGGWGLVTVYYIIHNSPSFMYSGAIISEVCSLSTTSCFLHGGRQGWIELHHSQALSTCKQKIEGNGKFSGPGNEEGYIIFKYTVSLILYCKCEVGLGTRLGDLCKCYATDR